MNDITIFGGTGFIGQSLIDYLKKNKKLGTKYKRLNIVSKSSKYKFFDKKFIFNYKFDLEKNSGQLPNTSDYIIYAADSNDYKIYKKNKKKYISKIKNFINIFKKKYSKSKLIYLSSGIVYGKDKKNKPPKENKKFNNINTVSKEQRGYCAAKRFGEKEIIKLGKKKNKVSIVRLYSFLGPRIPLNKHFLIGNIIKNILENKKKIVLKNKFMRSYMHTDDLIFYLLKIVKLSNYDCPIYNLGSDQIVDDKLLLKYFDNYLKNPIKKIKNYDFDYYIPNIIKLRYRFSLKKKFNFKKNLNMTLKEFKIQNVL